ncbi:MAG: zinc ABC transporter substrate-binding protein [Hyphomicrobium sp.]
MSLAAISTTLLATASAPVRAEAPRVAVTIKPIHALVTAIMDSVATPALIVDGAASPHTFSLRPSSAKAIHAADVFIRVSPATEPFTEKLLAALPKTVTAVTLADAASGVKLLPRRTAGAFEADVHAGHAGHDDHGADDHHGDSDANAAFDGHIWLDPDNGKAIVGHVVAVLSAKWPEHAARFSANGAALAQKIDALTAEMAHDLAPVSARPFIVFHDAYQYFERRFNLAAAGSVTLSADAQPSAKRLVAVRNKVREIGPACVFAEPGFQPKLLAAVTEGTSARSGTLDPEGLALTPGADLYFTLLRDLARNVRTCLSAAP